MKSIPAQGLARFAESSDTEKLIALEREHKVIRRNEWHKTFRVLCLALVVGFLGASPTFHALMLKVASCTSIQSNASLK